MAASQDPAHFCTRRRILGWGGVGVISGFAGYWSWLRHPSESAVRATSIPSIATAPSPVDAPLESPASATTTGGIHREEFLPHLKSLFQLDSHSRCTLVEVSAAQKIFSPTAEFTAFSLLFVAPGDFAAESKTYRLTHSHLGPLDLFISPVGRSKDQVHLEAICSQRV